ncbi:MAG: hypothetical protein WCX65_00455 [bacterium]
MLLKYRATESFYEGFQKTNIFADRTVRITAFIFVIAGLIDIPFKFIFPAGFKSELGSMLVFILLIFPISTRLIGGISRASWKLYAGFGIFFLSGLIPTLWGSPVFLLLMIPSVCFLALLLRAEPGILRSFGYSEKPLGMREVLIALLTFSLFALFTYIATVMVQKSKFILHSPISYLLQFLIVVPEYLVAWGILYGVLMKRLLELKFEPMVPIFLNIVFTLVWWVSTAVNVKDPGMMFAGIFAWAIAVHMISGMAYYFTGSVRPVLFAWSLNYIVFVASSVT